jgi:hypothetical protein
MIPVDLKKELTNLIYDCEKMEDKQAVEVAINKFKCLLRYKNSGYYNFTFSGRKYFAKAQPTEEEQFLIDCEKGVVQQ